MTKIVVGIKIERIFRISYQSLATKYMLEDMFESFKRSVLDKLELRINEQDKKIELLESTVSLKENVIDQLIKRWNNTKKN